ncbi:HIT family protein, partial [Methanocalculus natronophilus]|uniref:HIT family protein n=1 Tax=Methanocalculus natronophilus TaxID=1262400 RepID=UPI0031B646C1
MDCIFCKILEGEIPSYKVYEDDHIYAFLDITQTTKGHTLVIPKNHIKNIYELDSTLATQIFSKVPLITKALKEAFKPIGFNIINNVDKPTQSVFHFHVHIVPRYENDAVELLTPNQMENY